MSSNDRYRIRKDVFDAGPAPQRKAGGRITPKAGRLEHYFGPVFGRSGVELSRVARRVGSILGDSKSKWTRIRVYYGKDFDALLTADRKKRAVGELMALSVADRKRVAKFLGIALSLDNKPLL